MVKYVWNELSYSLSRDIPWTPVERLQTLSFALCSTSSVSLRIGSCASYVRKRQRRCIIGPSIGKGGTKTYHLDTIRPPVLTSCENRIKRRK
jgi:hypothetical protein